MRMAHALARTFDQATILRGQAFHSPWTERHGLIPRATRRPRNGSSPCSRRPLARQGRRRSPTSPAPMIERMREHTRSQCRGSLPSPARPGLNGRTVVCSSARLQGRPCWEVCCTMANRCRLRGGGRLSGRTRSFAVRVGSCGAGHDLFDIRAGSRWEPRDGGPRRGFDLGASTEAAPSRAASPSPSRWQQPSWRAAPRQPRPAPMRQAPRHQHRNRDPRHRGRSPATLRLALRRRDEHPEPRHRTRSGGFSDDLDHQPSSPMCSRAARTSSPSTPRRACTC